MQLIRSTAVWAELSTCLACLDVRLLRQVQDIQGGSKGAQKRPKQMLSCGSGHAAQPQAAKTRTPCCILKQGTALENLQQRFFDVGFFDLHAADA